MKSRNGRRSIKQTMQDAWEILKADIRNYGVAIGITAGYLLISMKLFYSTCPMKMITGFPCPGCGLTRAGFAVLRGNFARALEVHPMIFPILLLTFCFVLYRYILRKNPRVLLKYAAALLVLMGIFYLYRMVKYFPDKEPMTYYYGAVFRFLK